MGLKFKPGDVVQVSWLNGAYTVAGYDKEFKQYRVKGGIFPFYPLTREMKLLYRKKAVVYPEDGSWV